MFALIGALMESTSQIAFYYFHIECKVNMFVLEMWACIDFDISLTKFVPNYYFFFFFFGQESSRCWSSSIPYQYWQAFFSPSGPFALKKQRFDDLWKGFSGWGWRVLGVWGVGSGRISWPHGPDTWRLVWSRHHKRLDSNLGPCILADEYWP